MKKASAFSRDASGDLDDGACKRWSAVKRRALPVLEDVLGSGESFKSVLDAGERFTPTSTLDWGQLHDNLGCTDLSLALPQLRTSAPSRELAGSALTVHRSRSLFQRQLAESRGRLWSVAAQTAFQLGVRPGSGEVERDGHEYVLCAASHRSHTIVTILEKTAAGQLRLKDNAFSFCSMKDVMQDLGIGNNQGSVATTVTVKAMHLLHKSDDDVPAFATLQVDALPVPGSGGHHGSSSAAPSSSPLQASFCSVEEGAQVVAEVGAQPSASLKRQPCAAATDAVHDVAEKDEQDEQTSTLQAEMKELADLEAGYGFGGDEDESLEQASKLMDELDDSDIASRTSSAIAAGVGTDLAAGQSTGQIRRALERAKDVLRASNSNGSDVNVALTGEELEEEALLLLVKSQQQVSSQGATSSSVATPKSRETAFVRNQTDWTSVAACLEQEAGADDDLQSDDASSNDAGSAPAAQQGLAASSLVGGGETPAQAPAAAVRWVASMQVAVEALLNAGKGSLGQNDELAMMVRRPAGIGKPGELLFVKWVDVADRIGRLVRIDKQNRVVYCPAVMFGKAVPTQVFAADGYDCLVKAVGAASRKFRGAAGCLRDELPPAVLRMRTMTQVLLTYVNKALVVRFVDRRCFSET